MAYKVWNPNWSNESEAKVFEAEYHEEAVDRFIEANEGDQWEWPEDFRVCVLSDEGFFCMAEVRTVRQFQPRMILGGPYEYTCRMEDGGHSPTRSFWAKDAPQAAIMYADYIHYGSDEPRRHNEEYVVLVMSDKPSIRPSSVSKFLVIREGGHFSCTRTTEA